jgi:dihydroflavonol-4-reductase
LNAGHEVRALVRPTSDLRGLAGLACEQVLGDVREASAMRAACDGCDIVFHAAAIFAYAGYDKADMMSTASEGTSTVLRAARDAGIKRVVVTSSTAVLGGSTHPTPLDESAELLSQDVPDYFVSKAAQEKLAIREAQALGLELIVVNPAVILGPYDFRPSTSLATITSYLKDPLKLSYPGGINIVHAADVARGHILLAERGEPFERYIVGAENWQWPTIHRAIADLAGVAGPRLTVGRTGAYIGATFMELGSKVTRRPPMATRGMAKQVGRYFWYTHAKAAALGYRARPVHDTLRETLGWLLDSHHLSDKQKQALSPRTEVLDVRDHLRALERARQVS